MRDYATIKPQFWIGETGRQLRGNVDAQLVAMYLMTCPKSNMIGLFTCPNGTISSQVGIPIRRVNRALRNLIGHGFCRFDFKSGSVWVKNMARYQLGNQLKKTDNRIVAIKRQLDEMADCPFLQEFYDEYGESLCLLDDGERPIGPGQGASASPSRSQRTVNREQRTENREEDYRSVAAQPHSPKTPSAPRGSGRPKTYSKAFLDFWTAYPRKVGKADASKAYQRAAKHLADSDCLDPAGFLRHQAEQFAASPAGNAGEFVPYPATWLNQARYEDDPAEWRRERAEDKPKRQPWGDADAKF